MAENRGSNSDQTQQDDEHEIDQEYEEDYFDDEEDDLIPDEPEPMVWNLCYEKQYFEDELESQIFGMNNPSPEDRIALLAKWLPQLNTQNVENLDVSGLLANNLNKCRICESPEKTKACSACKTAYYCSIDHQKSDWKVHKQFCPSLVTRTQDLNFLKKPIFSELTFPKTLYSTPERVPKSWDEYFELRPFSEQFNGELQKKGAFWRCLVDALHYSLTLLFCLNKFGFVENRAKTTRTHIVVHIIGAEDATEVQLPDLRYHELVHMLPDSIDLTLVLVGPAISPHYHARTSAFFKNRLNVQSFSVDYASFILGGNFVPPNFVFAPNGHICNPSWSQVITLLVKLGVPTCFTCPTERDLQLSQQAVSTNYGARIIFNDQNPFASPRWCIDPWDPHSLYRPSQFLLAFHGVREDKRFQ